MAKAPKKETPSFWDPSDNLYNAGFLIDIYHVPTGAEIKFKAWLTNFNDSYQSNWNTEETYGRMDPIATFQNTVRSINISWDVVAASLKDAKENMASCELLFRMLYPTYDNQGGSDNASSISGSPLFKLKFGNLITMPGAAPAAPASTAGLLGTMNGFEYAPDLDAGFFTPANAQMYPQTISLSAEFQVLHNFPIGWEGGKFRESKYPYGEAANPSEALHEAGRKFVEDNPDTVKAAAETVTRAGAAALDAGKGLADDLGALASGAMAWAKKAVKGGESQKKIDQKERKLGMK